MHCANRGCGDVEEYQRHVTLKKILYPSRSSRAEPRHAGDGSQPCFSPCSHVPSTPKLEENALFRHRPYQGAEPSSETFLFVGLDANYPPDL